MGHSFRGCGREQVLVMARKPGPTTRREVLRLAGMKLYGEGWVADLANRLETHEMARTDARGFMGVINNWVNGSGDVPNWVFGVLGESISEQIEDLEDIRDQVGRMLE